MQQRLLGQVLLVEIERAVDLKASGEKPLFSIALHHVAPDLLGIERRPVVEDVLHLVDLDRTGVGLAAFGLRDHVVLGHAAKHVSPTRAGLLGVGER